MTNSKDANAPDVDPAQELFAEFLDDYFAECDEHLTSVRRALLKLEGFVHNPQVDRALVDELFRSFHSLKGISAMVGLGDAELLAHHLESYLRGLRQNEIMLAPGGMDGLIEGTKSLEQVIAARRDNVTPPAIAPAIVRLEAALSGNHDAQSSLVSEPQAVEQPVSSGENSMWQFVFTPSAELAERGITVNTIRERLGQAGELVRAAPKVLPEGGIAFEFIVAASADESMFSAWLDDGLKFAPYQPSEARRAEVIIENESATARPAAASVAPSSIVRVSLSRLDELMRLAGELVISRSRLDEQLKNSEGAMAESTWRSLQETNQILERHLRDLRQAILRVRMVPIGETFERMQFVARDLARDHQKKIRLELAGQDTEIDKLLVERMMEPLIHLVRNAVSHGLEPASERAGAGKPAEAVISLGAFTAGEMVVIEIRDDGRGIDRRLVQKRAEQMGLIDDAVAMDDARLLDVICSPGFSTREEADRASGRGVGMAVVRNTIESLGGSLELETVEGRGTSFRIELPVTLAIADALIVAVGRERFAVPQSAVREVIEVGPSAVKAFENNEVIQYRRGVLPVIRLARLFNLEENRGSAFHAFVVGSESNAVAIAVDRILGQREIVVRAITDPLIQVAGIAGATELGDGRVVLILDAAGVIGRKQSAAGA